MSAALGLGALVLAALVFVAWVYAMGYGHGERHERDEWFRSGSTRHPRG